MAGVLPNLMAVVASRESKGRYMYAVTEASRFKVLFVPTVWVY